MKKEIFDFVEDFVDDPNNIDNEPEKIETDDHDSKSEEEMEWADEEDVETKGESFRFFIEKDGEILWASSSVSKSMKTKPKNVVKIFPRPKGDVRRCTTEFECLFTYNQFRNCW